MSSVKSSLTKFPSATLTARGTWVRTIVSVSLYSTLLSSNYSRDQLWFCRLQTLFQSPLSGNHLLCISWSPVPRPTRKAHCIFHGSHNLPKDLPEALRNDSAAALGSALVPSPMPRNPSRDDSFHTSKQMSFWSFPYMRHHTASYTYLHVPFTITLFSA